MERKLYRSANDRAILGICGGIGEYLDIDPIVIRLIVVILTLLGFSGLLLYIIAIFIIPESPEYRAAREGTYRQTTYEYTYGGNGMGESAKSGQTTYDYEVGPYGEVKEAPKGAGETTGTYEVHKDLSEHARERSKNRTGNSALILGLCLIAIGVFALLRVFFPWIDTRLLLAIGLIAMGILVIVKR